MILREKKIQSRKNRSLCVECVHPFAGRSMKWIWDSKQGEQERPHWESGICIDTWGRWGLTVREQKWTKTWGRVRKVQKDLHDRDNHNGVITHLEPDILECEVKWALESITMNKASGCDGIPVKLFQILKDDAVKVLHSICQQIWKN